MVERVARAIMEAGTGCQVADWREAEWNPHIAQVLKEAEAAVNAISKLDDSTLHEIASSYVLQAWPGMPFDKWHEGDAKTMKERLGAAFSYALSGEGLKRSMTPKRSQ